MLTFKVNLLTEKFKQQKRTFIIISIYANIRFTNY